MFDITHSYVLFYSAFSFFERDHIDSEAMQLVKQMGFSDQQIGSALNVPAAELRDLRIGMGVTPWVKQVCKRTVKFKLVNGYRLFVVLRKSRAYYVPWKRYGKEYLSAPY